MSDLPSSWPHALAITQQVMLEWWWMLIAVLFLYHYSRSWGIWLFALFSLPGTIAHELTHWLIAFLLGGRPSFPSVWPKRTLVNNQEYWRLGEVRSQLSWWRGPFVGLAPLLLIPVGIMLLQFGLDTQGWGFWLLGWIGSLCLISSLPSRQDWILAFQKGGLLLILATGFTYSLFHFSS